jgi:predicted AlkP superfamily phosphohydrolase/phosphomutase
MTQNKGQKLDRREFLKRSAAVVATGMGLKSAYAASKSLSGKRHKVVVIGIDGMDPRLSDKMMKEGRLPHFAALAEKGGFKTLGTSIPPQSPVAWANFINGAGPGSHGIFDFIHRHPEKQCAPFFAMAETVPGAGYWEIGRHKIQLNFWPFSHKLPATILQRQGTPFWDELDEASVDSVFYNLPSNYPPSPSKYGHHRCLAGMGTPDLLGTYGTYQHFAEDGPVRTLEEGGGKRSLLFFEDDRSARGKIIGPVNSFLTKPEPATIDFVVHRDTSSSAAMIEVQKHKILLKEGQWSDWIKLDFEMSMPALMPNKHVSGICRFYLQQFSPEFRLYVSPINSDPSDSALRLTEPPQFIKEISNDLGLFYTTGFQEDHKALSNKVFSDAEYASQAGMVLQERLNLLNYAVGHYEDGLLFFYFSSTDLQGHMFWWDSDEKHPTRSAADAKMYFVHLQDLYRQMDNVLADVLKRYGREAAVIVMSDHGFANFKRQFNLNSWLRDNGYLYPHDAASVLRDVDWEKTKAYGLGINGLYLNLKGREKYGIVQPGQQREELLEELVSGLEAVRDTNGRSVVRKAHRSDKAYVGQATAFAPDVVVGYCRDYRASWATCLGDMTKEVLLDNDSAWSADHCADVSELPGVVFANRPIAAENPALIDLGPTILTEFGLKPPASMEGKNIFKI